MHYEFQITMKLKWNTYHLFSESLKYNNMSFYYSCDVVVSFYHIQMLSIMWV